MFITELQQISKDRDARYLREAFDFGDISSIEVADDKVHHRGGGDGQGLQRHVEKVKQKDQVDGAVIR